MADLDKDLDLIIRFASHDKPAAAMIIKMVDVALTPWKTRLGFLIDDAKSDTIFDIWKEVSRGDFDLKSGLFGFVKTLANRNCIDIKRSRKRIEETPVDDLLLVEKAPTAEQILEEREVWQLSFRVMRRVPEECRRIWRMALKERMSYKEIAKRLGKSERKVNWKMWWCRERAKRIREELLKKDKLLWWTSAFRMEESERN